ncbi:MAG TPA: glycoside hydrolase family 16 protein [Candidatus Saccharimonadia bacterium]|jgi:beta-glucanase (GH16 family)|nr:glycoside hydrolase family 16 protein [Candidatus Saccharimonadia bacterium]
MNTYAFSKAKNLTRLAAVVSLAALVLIPAMRTAMAQSQATPSVQPASMATPAIDRMPSNGAWTYNFADLVDGPLPRADWNFEVGTKVASNNSEEQAYTARTNNVRVENGTLVIEAQPETMDGKQYTSARIDTHGKFDFDYGTLEVDMMLPPGVGTWPAAWLMPAENAYDPQHYGIAKTDPYAWVLNGEIDFAEEVGRIPGQNIPAAHSYNSRTSGVSQYTPAYVPNPYGAYHRYGIIKTPDKLTFTLDGRPYATRVRTGDSVLDWPFNQRYYLILNLAIGGTWAGDDGIDNASAPWLLKVRSISYQPL